MWNGTTEAGSGEPQAWLREGIPLRVVAATHEAIGVEVPSSVNLVPGQSVEFSLGAAHRLVGPVVAHVGFVGDRAGDSLFAVLELKALPSERRRRLAELLLRLPQAVRRSLPPVAGLAARLLSDPRHLEAVVSCLAAEEEPGLVRLPDEGPYTVTRVRAAGFDRWSELSLRWQVEGTVPEPPFVIEVSAYDFLYVFPVTRARMQDGLLCTDLSPEILRLPLSATWLRGLPPGSRWELRLPDGTNRPIIRASTERVAWVLRPGERPSPGARINVLLEDEGATSIEGCLAVLNSLPSPVGAEHLCLARFEPRAPADASRWALAVERLHHPHTRRAGTWATYLWELYDKSGYFRLSGKTSAHFSRLRQPFAIATRRLDTASEIGCQVVWPSQDRVEAGLSILLVYSGTAMVYQVARRRDSASPVSGRQMLRAINQHAFSYMQRVPHFEWTLVYVQEGGARWSHLAYELFTRAHLDTGLCAVLRFRAMESTRAASRSPHVRGVSVARATEDERALLLGMLPAMRPIPYLEALDLVPERLDLAEVRRRWNGAGFSREREVLVARGPRGPLAAAVLESAQDALHLFGLLDCVRFFILAPEGHRSFPSLIESARLWFEERRKERFVCLFEEECLDHAFQPGLQDLGSAHLMAFPRLLLPDFLEHLHLITAPRREGH